MKRVHVTVADPFTVFVREFRCYFCRENTKRLSATDISALASMKNVAKCDTWCELQNPVNHRVFERKLRPKPLGRGHVCLGVTHRRPHQTSSLSSGQFEGGNWLPVRSPRAVGLKKSLRRLRAATIGGNAFSCLVRSRVRSSIRTP